jgi:hypothetical protein
VVRLEENVMPLRSQYCVVRYVPDVVRDEGVNIGVVLETGANGNRASVCKFAESLNRAAKLDPSLKSSAIERVIKGALEQINRDADDLSLEELVANFSGGRIQLTKPRVTVIENIQQELTELFGMFVIDEREERHHGKTEPILKKEVRQALMRHGIESERVRYSTTRQRLTLSGRHASHSFDMSVKVNNHEEYVECISFDVENYAAKLDATKVLVYDSKDIKAEHTGIDIISILYPPKTQSGREPQRMFTEAQTILRDEGLETFNFDVAAEKGRLLERIQ